MPDDRQLDLFAAPPPPEPMEKVPAPAPIASPAQAGPRVVTLPCRVWGPAIWRPRVTRVATKLAAKSEKAKAAYWKQTADTLRYELQRRGATEQEAEEQIAIFFDAVDNIQSKVGPGAAK